ALHVRSLGAGHLPGLHQRPQLGERRGRAVRLSLAAVGAAARGAHPADPRIERAVLMRIKGTPHLPLPASGERVYRSCALLLVAASGLGCTNFQDPTTVVDLRMLAVMVEPSEIILDADLSNPLMPTIVDPDSNPIVTV